MSPFQSRMTLLPLEANLITSHLVVVACDGRRMYGSIKYHVLRTPYSVPGSPYGVDVGRRISKQAVIDSGIDIDVAAERT